jgi:hypothetical protein
MPAGFYNPVKKVPLLGKWYSRAGRTYQILSSPCNPEPSIAVYAAWVSLPRLVWTLFKPDFIDLKYDQVKAGFHRHGRKGKFKIHTIDVPKYPVPKGLGWAIFAGAEFAQRVGWYLCVIDATTEFAVNWSTLTYQYAGCVAPGIGFGNCDGGSEFNYRDGQSRFAGFTTFNSGNGLVATVTGVGVPNGWNWSGGCGATIGPPSVPGLEQGSGTCQLYDFKNNIQIGEMQSKQNPDGTTTFSTQHYQNVGPLPGADLGILVSGSGNGWFTVSSANLNVTASHLKLNLDLKPDPP